MIFPYVTKEQVHAAFERSRQERWAKHGPALLAAAQQMIDLERLAVSGVLHVGIESRSWQKLRDAIADCEQIEGKDDAKD